MYDIESEGQDEQMAVGGDQQQRVVAKWIEVDENAPIDGMPVDGTADRSMDGDVVAQDPSWSSHDH